MLKIMSRISHQFHFWAAKLDNHIETTSRRPSTYLPALNSVACIFSEAVCADPDGVPRTKPSGSDLH